MSDQIIGFLVYHLAELVVNNPAVRQVVQCNQFAVLSDGSALLMQNYISILFSVTLRALPSTNIEFYLLAK